MNTVQRTFGVVFIVVLLAVGVFGLRYACSSRDMLSVIHRAEDVERLHTAMLRHQEGQYQAAGEWMTQRCTWEEAMQRLQELDQDMDQAWPGYTRLLEETMQRSAEERHYQFIRHYVQTVLHQRPEDLTVALRRLERDSSSRQTTSAVPTSSRLEKQPGKQKQSAPKGEPKPERKDELVK
jgi:hypothetical protein